MLPGGDSKYDQFGRESQSFLILIVTASGSNSFVSHVVDFLGIWWWTSNILSTSTGNANAWLTYVLTDKINGVHVIIGMLLDGFVKMKVWHYFLGSSGLCGCNLAKNTLPLIFTVIMG